jgi:alcohol oxidase
MLQPVRTFDIPVNQHNLILYVSAYVHSVMDIQNNLFLRTNSKVSRVIFEGDKAVGVAYVPARNRAHGGQLRETIVKARKCVVISSGTLGTPQILERSGVGAASLLKKLDIKVVSDLPGVGYVCRQRRVVTTNVARLGNNIRSEYQNNGVDIESDPTFSHYTTLSSAY